MSRLAGQGNSRAEVESAAAAARAAALRGAAIAPRLVVVARSVPDLASRTRRDLEHAGVVILADA